MLYALYINVISFVKFIMLLIHLKLLSANISNINSAQDIRLKPSINIKYFPKVLKSSKPQLAFLHTWSVLECAHIYRKTTP